MVRSLSGGDFQPRFLSSVDEDSVDVTDVTDVDDVEVGEVDVAKVAVTSPLTALDFSLFFISSEVSRFTRTKKLSLLESSPKIE